MLITCLGLSGSGKTMFLGSLLDNLHSPINTNCGFYLHKYKGTNPIGVDGLNKEDITPRIPTAEEQEAGWGGYPSGTNITTPRSFHLMQGNDPVLEITWIDYKGGLLAPLSNPNLEEANKLYKFLDDSTAIVIYFDGYRIANAPSDKTALRWIGAEPIATVLKHLEDSKRNDIANILIVLTQCDAIEDEKWLGEDQDYAPLIKHAKGILGGLIDMFRRNSHWNCGIVAVSAIGRGRNRRTIKVDGAYNILPELEDLIIGEPEPQNIIESFFWFVGCELATQKFKANKKGAFSKFFGKNSLNPKIEAALDPLINASKDVVTKL